MRVRWSFLVFSMLSACGPSAAPRPEPSEAEGVSSEASGASVILTCAGTPPSEFAALDTSCETAADCVMVRHRRDCCGSYEVVGLRSSDVARFEAAEAACEATVAMCRCAAHADVASDGSGGESFDAVPRVMCIEQRCATTFRP
jgi:hypothetical protein